MIAFESGLYIVIIVMAAANLAVFFRYWSDPPAWVSVWNVIYTLVYCGSCFGVALISLVRHEWVEMALYSFFCVAVSYTWWNNDDNRRKRRRLKDKTAAKVAEVAGRLKVIHPAAREA
jgi:uncharacterized membrane protein YfcA